jgi:hypothetical protein
MKVITHSGVTDCACCGEHIMVNDIRVANLCDWCTEEGCTENSPQCD